MKMGRWTTRTYNDRMGGKGLSPLEAQMKHIDKGKTPNAIRQSAFTTHKSSIFLAPTPTEEKRKKRKEESLTFTRGNDMMFGMYVPRFCFVFYEIYIHRLERKVLWVGCDFP